MNTSNNQINGFSYDLNGNQTTVNVPGSGSQPVTYDIENRTASIGSTEYSYSPSNQRVGKGTLTGYVLSGDEFFFYGIDGAVLAAYQLKNGASQNMYLSMESAQAYFGRTLIMRATTFPTTGSYPGPQWAPVDVDRLGSMRADTTLTPNQQTSSYFPYGEERGSTPNERTKFATYWGDNETGLGYAMNRYYNNVTGRFLTADPYMASSGGPGNPTDPGSWNRYEYAGNDPVNHIDPTGQNYCEAGWDGEEIWQTCWLSQIGGHLLLLGGDPVGGGGPVYDNKNLLADVKKRVQSDLAKADCARGFKNASKDISKLSSIGYKSYAMPTEVTGPDGSLQVKSGITGLYIPVLGFINLNSNINWEGPNNTPAIVNGKSGIYPALSAEQAYINVPALTAGQFMDLMILHELSHYNGSIGNPDKGPSDEEQLYRDCIK